MSARIHSYRPGIKIKIGRRDPEAMDSKTDIDLSRALGDTGSCTITKSLYAPVGEFTIVLPDKPFNPGPGDTDSLYGIVSPLDPIEIQMSRALVDGIGNLLPIEWHTVLRGVVRSVGRNEAVGGDGRVQRNVVISGHDCGAFFLMQQIRAFVTYLDTGAAIPPSLAYLLGSGLPPEPKPIGDVIWDVADFTTKDLMASAGFEWEWVYQNAKGWFVPSAVFSGEGPVWALLHRISDPPWNELFVREGKDKPELVFRPTPWRTLDKKWLDGAVPPTFWVIPVANIVALNAHRDDTEVVQYIWPHMQVWGQAQNARPLTAGWPQPSQKYAPRNIAGTRMQEISSSVGAEMPPNNLPEKDQEKADKDHVDWGIYRAKWIAEASEEAIRLESGDVTFKGDPRVRVGEYITIPRGDVKWSAYAVAVRHVYRGFQNYLTTVQYIRGEQYVERLKANNPWYGERKTT